MNVLRERLGYPHLRPRQSQTTVVTPALPPSPTAVTTTTTAAATTSASSSSSSVPSSSSVTTVSSSTSSSTVSSIPPTTVTSLTTSTRLTPTQPTSSDTSTTSLLTTSTTSDSVSRISRFISTGSDGAITTITTIVDPDASSTSSTTNNNNSGENTGFLQNKAAMGATFAVAGLAAAVFAFLFITTCIRRRRAMKFDRDVAAAAAAAAAESHAIQPFDDDDDDVFTGAPRAQAGGYGYAPGKLPEHDPYTYAAAGVIGGPSGFGAAAQPMRQQQTGGPLAYPTPQQYPVQPYDQPYNGGVFGRQVGQQEAYNMQDLAIPLEMPRRPGSAGTGTDTLPGIAGVGTQGNISSSGAGSGAGDSRNSGFSALVGAAGLAGSAGAAAAAAFRNRHEDPYGGYTATPPVGESRYPQPRWSQQQIPQSTLPEQLQSGWYQQQGQQPVQRAPSPPTSTSTHGPAPAYSPGGLTAQGYPNEKSTYSSTGFAPSAPTSSNEGPSTTGHTAVTTNVPGTPPDDDDVGSVLEDHEGPRVLKVTNE